MAGISDVASKLAQEYNITVASAKTMIVTVMDVIVDLAKTERTKVGNHVFKPYVTKARNGRNPKTGESLIIPEKKGVKYKFIGDKKIEKVAPTPAGKSPKKSQKKK